MYLFSIKIFIIAFSILIINCNDKINSYNIYKNDRNITKNTEKILPGIYSFIKNTEQIKNKKIALVCNHTSVIDKTHLADTLLSLGYSLIKIFAPEHGFRGDADAGAVIHNDKDIRTNLDIISLYGNHKKPTKEQLADIDVVIFDIQDVGVRFYTYLSTLHYVIEACGENNIKLIILDRTNPNANYIDGPILDTNTCRSFIGLHPVPIVYGMTIGEYGKMILGEKWTKIGNRCDLEVIACKNYSHNNIYELSLRPSPNLPNTRSINLYPSLCFFEGTTLSVGRGTEKQFQIVGHVSLDSSIFKFSFTPKANYGDKNPVLNNKRCYGIDLSQNNFSFSFNKQISINFLQYMYNNFPDKNNFFKKTNSFDIIAGNKELKQQIINGTSEEIIRSSWESGLENFKKVRQKYLIYN